MATSIIPAEYDMTIYQGATFLQEIIWKESDTPVDVSGYTAAMQIRATHPDGVTPTATYDQLLATLTTENGGIVLGGSLGSIQLVLSAAATAALPATPARYDLEMTETATGYVYRILMGELVISGEVTRG